MIKITVLVGKTFRGVQHFIEVNYDCSDELARYAVKEGIARFADSNHLSDPNSYKGAKGPNDN